MPSHLLDRTNPLGVAPFVGRCRWCGQENLRAGDALAACPKAGTRTDDGGLLEMLDEPRSQKEGE